jgi:hypothetical protein
MDCFPSHFTPDNDREVLRDDRILYYVRQYIYESMLKPDFSIPGNCGIDLTQLSTGLIPNSYKLDEETINIIINELEDLGWKTTLGFGSTVLFVHTHDKIPAVSNCKSF